MYQADINMKNNTCTSCVFNGFKYIYQKINFNFNYPRTHKNVKILGMSLILKKVCPAYKTCPITERKNALANSVAPVFIQMCVICCYQLS